MATQIKTPAEYDEMAVTADTLAAETDVEIQAIEESDPAGAMVLKGKLGSYLNTAETCRTLAAMLRAKAST